MLYVEMETILVRTPPKPSGPSGFDAFLRIAERGTPFTALGGRAFITVPAQFSGGHLTFPIRCRAFRQWVFDQCFSLYDTIPTTHAFNAILHHLEAQAARDPQHCNVGVPYRVDCRGPCPTPEKILLDLANPEGQFVEITPEGWTVTSREGAPFETSSSSRPLPSPAHPTTAAPQVPPIGSPASPGSSPPSAHTAPSPSSSSVVLPAAANPSPPASSGLSSIPPPRPSPRFPPPPASSSPSPASTGSSPSTTSPPSPLKSPTPSAASPAVSVSPPASQVTASRSSFSSSAPSSSPSPIAGRPLPLPGPPPRNPPHPPPATPPPSLGPKPPPPP